MNKNRTNQIVLSGLLIALGVTLPMIFHFFGGVGKVFLPMHLPIIIGGFLLGSRYAVLVGVLTPLISSLTTGMPPTYPILPIMMVELGTYGLVISYLTKRGLASTWVKLVSAMILGRITAGLTVFILGIGFGLKMNPIIYLKTAIVVGIPGLIIQLVIVPAFVNLNIRYFKFGMSKV